MIPIRRIVNGIPASKLKGYGRTRIIRIHPIVIGWDKYLSKIDCTASSRIRMRTRRTTWSVVILTFTDPGAGVGFGIK